MSSESEFFKIGEVISVDGRTVNVKVFKTKNTSKLFFNGKVIKNVSVGSYIKIIKGFIKIIGKVDGEYIKEDEFYAEKDYKSTKSKIDRIIRIKMFGYFDENNEFVRGIKELPLIYNKCYLLTNDEFGKINNFVSPSDEALKIGVLSFEKNHPIKLGVNALFASHFGIFGNTGSGKSYTLASVYRKLFLKYKDNELFRKNAHFFLLDFNGEYIDSNVIIEDKYKLKYNLSTRSKGDKYPVSENTLNDVEFWSIFLTATEKTQKPFLARTLKKKDINSKDENEDKYIEKLTKRMLKSGNESLFDFLYNMNSFLKEPKNFNEWKNKLLYNSKNKAFYCKGGKNGIYANSELDKVLNLLGVPNSSDYYFKLKDNLPIIDKIQLKIIFYYYYEIEQGYSNQEHLAPLLKRLEKRVNDLKKVIKKSDENEDNQKNDKFLTIVSLRDVNLDMKKMIPLLLCKYLYRERKKQHRSDNKKYLNIIIDEAHNILSYESQRESEIWKDYRLETFEEIIKEGRKFGVFLTIVSQRPSDISSTILSQLHNYFLHRLINERDIQTIERTVSYLDKVSFESLSILPTGTCIFAGISSNVPVIINIDKIDESQYEPKNKTIDIVKEWQNVESKNKS